MKRSLDSVAWTAVAVGLVVSGALVNRLPVYPVAVALLLPIKLPDDARMWVRLFESIGIGQWFRYVTAIVEITGGVLMLVPRATPVAVLLTSSAMVGALAVHATVTGFGPQTVAASVLLALSLFVAWSRSRQ